MNVGILMEKPLVDEGGGYTFQREILTALVNYGNDTGHRFVIFHDDDEPPEAMNAASHITFVSLHRDEPEGLMLRFKKGLSKLFSRSAYLRRGRKTSWRDYVQEQLRAYHIDILWYLSPYYAPFLDIPYIVTVWDLQHRLQPFFPEVSIKGEWQGRENHFQHILPRAAFIITGTETGKREIESFYQISPYRIKVLPLPTPGFSLTVAHSPASDVLTKHHIAGDYLFYPAHFWAHKNHIVLLLAVKLLKDKYGLDVSLVFAGSDRGNAAYIRHMAERLDIGKRVHILGFVTQDDIVAFYRHATALTYVSFFGPDNIPPLEAFALGCPVIVSDVDGMKEQLGDAALFVDPKNEEEIAHAVKTLYDDAELRRRHIQLGTERAKEWTGQHYIRGMAEIIDAFGPVRRCWK